MRLFRGARAARFGKEAGGIVTCARALRGSMWSHTRTSIADVYWRDLCTVMADVMERVVMVEVWVDVFEGFPICK